MHGVHFRIFPTGNRWNWQILGPKSEVREEGLANTKAEAAAFIIRGTVRPLVEAIETPSLRKAA